MKLSIVVIFLFSHLINAQTNRFIYELKYKELRTDQNYATVNMHLDINPEDVKYYDQQLWKKDSTNMIHFSENTNWSDFDAVIRKKNSYKNKTITLLSDQLFSYESTDIISWKLSTETSKHHNFNTQKATTTFGGRKWIAWFTKDIPFSEGPYKLKGLPGLIVKLEDNNKNFIFELIETQNLVKTYDTKNILEIRYGNKPITTNIKQLQRKAMEYYNDPLNEIRQELTSGKVTKFTYNNVSYKPEELHQLVKEEQDYILKYYNPIELDIAYPFYNP